MDHTTLAHSIPNIHAFDPTILKLHPGNDAPPINETSINVQDL